MGPGALMEERAEHINEEVRHETTRIPEDGRSLRGFRSDALGETARERAGGRDRSRRPRKRACGAAAPARRGRSQSALRCPCARGGEERLEVLSERAAEAGALHGRRSGLSRMLEREDLDAVVIATPWRWHTPSAVE